MRAPGLTVHPVDGIGAVRAGDDLAGLLLDHLVEPLADGDVVTVTSKVVSKAAGLVVPGDRQVLVAAETDRVVADLGTTAVVRTHGGLTLAAAGVDASNLPPGHAVPLPPDPDRAARTLRAEIISRTSRQVAVVVTDTVGRPWRLGQTDIAVGVAGLVPVHDLAGRLDLHGNPLAVTAPALADEVAGAAELACGKLAGRPFAVVRGLAEHVLPPDEDGPGARALIRPEREDVFGWGSTEAVRAAHATDDMSLRGFPAPRGPVVDLVRAAADEAVRSGAVECSVHEGTERPAVEVCVRTDATEPDLLEAGATVERLRATLRAHRMPVTAGPGGAVARPGWRVLVRLVLGSAPAP